MNYINTVAKITLNHILEKSDFIITLIRPPVVSSLYSASSPVTPPVALAYLTASLENSGYKVCPIDALGEALDQTIFFKEEGYRLRGISSQETLDKIPPESRLIGISCMFSQDWLFLKEFINKVKKKFPDIPLILGGEHISAVPEEVMSDCPGVDICVLGEGEETVIEIAEYFNGIGKKIEEIQGIVYRDEHGNIYCNELNKRIREVEKIPRPNWDRFPIENYLEGGYGHGPYAGRTMPILATRGCPYQCTFCSGPRMWGRRYYARKPSDVVDEIEYYVRKYRAHNIDFFDLTAFMRKDWIMEFGKLLKDRNLKIRYSIPSGTRSEVLNEETLKILAETGCTYIVYAAESASKDTLKRIKKNIDLPRMFRSMRIAKRNNMKVRCNLIIGFPGERRIDMLKTLWFQLKLAFVGIDEAPLFGFAPYPGSVIFNELVHSGKIPKRDEKYYKGLLCETDLTKSSSCTDFIGEKEVMFYRILGVTLFFGLSYILFPWRIIRSIRNIFFRQKMDTIFEQRIFEFLQAYKLIKNKKNQTVS